MESYSYLRRNYDDSESFEEYFALVCHVLPGLPAPVLRQLFYDHFQSTVDRLGWLDFQEFIFREESWETSRIIDEVKAWNEEAVRCWKEAFYISSDWQVGLLVTYMYSQGKWPVPPVVIDNTMGLFAPSKGHLARWELVEGHHRLAYLRALFEHPEWRVEEKHRVWVMKHKHG